MSDKPHVEQTSADAIAIAFDYQYYYFLFKLFSLNEGESVGLEVQDDVHTELNNNIQILIQLKHSILTKTNGDIKNLTTLDSDLWKTISNWCKVIIDENDNRNTLASQLSFTKKTYFILVTNKSHTTQNMFIQNIDNFKNSTITLATFKQNISSITTTDNDIKGYINDLLNLDEEVLKIFIQNIEFNLNEDNLIHKCKTALKSDKIPEENIDELFKKLDSSIREDNYMMIKNKQKVLIDFTTYYKKYRLYYDESRNTDLKIRKFNISLPNELSEQNFIKQLIDIEDLDESEIDLIIRYTKYKLQIENNIMYWLQESEITNEEIEDFEEESSLVWENEFRTQNRGNLTEEEIKSKALLIISNLRKEKLKISTLDLDIKCSNGEFYSLCDNDKIGWRKDWETKYNE